MKYSKINIKGLIKYPTNTGYTTDFKSIKNISTTKDKAKIYTICG